MFDAEPEDWEATTLGAVCLGKGEYGANVSKSDFDPALPRYVRITDISETGSLLADSLASISLSDSADYMLSTGDLLLARSGATVGKSFLYDQKYGPCAFAGYLIRFRPNPTRIDPYFARLTVDTPSFWAWVKTVNRAGAQPNINAQEYANLPILLPSLDEQRRIAKVVRSLDECLDVAAAEISQLEKVRVGTVAKAFCDVSSPSLPESRANEGWVRVRFRDVFKERKERGLPDLPVASIGIDAGLVLRSSLDRRVESGLSEEEHALVRAGDIAYNMMRMWQGACGLANAECLVSPAYVVMSPTKALVPRFALLMLRSPPVVKLLHAYSQGIVDDRLRLYPDAFEQIPVNVPPLQFQCKIVEELSVIDNNLEKTRAARDQLVAVRSKLLGELLSGSVRVPV